MTTHSSFSASFGFLLNRFRKDNQVFLKNTAEAINPPAMTCNNKLPVPGSMYKMRKEIVCTAKDKNKTKSHINIFSNDYSELNPGLFLSNHVNMSVFSIY